MSTERSPLSTRLILGIGITILGVVLLLDRIEMFDADRLTRFWPLILIAIGIKILLDAAKTGRWFGGAIVTLLGLFFLGRKLDLFDIGLDELWPVFIILAGIGILSRGFGQRDGKSALRDDDHISQFGILCGLSPKIGSQSFKGGEVNAFMGGVEVDLTQADIADEEAVIVVFAMMGGIEIKVPRTWTVSSHVTPFMGAMEDKTDQSEAVPEKQLVIRGFVMMGGVEVTN
jgi:hypothetical protein